MGSRLRIALAALGVVAIGLLAFFAYGGASSSGPEKDRLAAWVHDTGLGQSFGTLHSDGHGVVLVISTHRGTGALHTVCAVLTDDTATAMANLPSPDVELNQLLARAYQLDYRAGNDCYSAGSDAKRQAQAEAELTAGQRLLTEAVQRIDVATDSTLSTTTTTTPGSGGIFG